LFSLKYLFTLLLSVLKKFAESVLEKESVCFVIAINYLFYNV